MITIDGHTFENENYRGSFFNQNGWTIDAGCRGMDFTKYCKEALIQNVLALDIENFINIPAGVIFKHAALTTHSGEVEAHYFGNGSGNFLKGLNGIPGNSVERPCETKKVKCITLEDIYSEIGTDIDLLKLDIEGAEYEVLLNARPIPKQITVEFHQHTNEILHNQYIDAVIDHLCKDYNMAMFIREWPRYKYMDVLFTRKDL